MTQAELLGFLASAIEGLSLDDLFSVVDRLGVRRGWPPVPNVLRYQVSRAVEAAEHDPEALVALANAVLAVVLGWQGAPILTLADLRQ